MVNGIFHIISIMGDAVIICFKQLIWDSIEFLQRITVAGLVSDDFYWGKLLVINHFRKYHVFMYIYLVSVG